MMHTGSTSVSHTDWVVNWIATGCYSIVGQIRRLPYIYIVVINWMFWARGSTRSSAEYCSATQDQLTVHFYMASETLNRPGLLPRT